MSDNLSLWKSLEKTNPAHTKPFVRSGGFKGTAISPMQLIKRMTEQFGPIGKGWGYDIVDHSIIPVEGGEQVCFVLVRAWYTVEGSVYYSGPQWGGDSIVSRRRDGALAVDDEAMKKATTDGLTKCLSYIGLGADVHLGMHDDSKYLNALLADNAAAEKPKRDPRLTDLAGKIIKAGKLSQDDYASEYRKKVGALLPAGGDVELQVQLMEAWLGFILEEKPG